MPKDQKRFPFRSFILTKRLCGEVTDLTNLLLDIGGTQIGLNVSLSTYGS